MSECTNMDAIEMCPFCGAEAKIESVISAVQVRCTECVCGTGPYADDEVGRRNAVSAWNRRGNPASSTAEKLSHAVDCIIARCEALENEAQRGIATVSVNGRDGTHEAGFWRGQKSTAKSIREHFHDMTRAPQKTR